MYEIRRFNIGYHLNAGVEYSLENNISLILGLGYESNIIDITKDIDTMKTDYTSQKFLRFIFGINF
jgi:opacity protein-like surface antigen